MIFTKASEKKSVKARSKPSEYEAMLRNGFIMPKLNSTIVNKIYMYRVKSGLEYCPMTSDIKVYKICINPPSKDYLLSQIYDELVKKGDKRDLTYDGGHLPDVEWCVKSLLALNPDHHIFDKDYVPGINEKGRKCNRFEQTFNEEDSNQFEEFDKGLPSYLQSQFFQNSKLTGRSYQSRKNQRNMNEDTLTEKDINDANFDGEKSNLMSENKMEIQEPLNPFVQKNMQNLNNNSAIAHRQSMLVCNNVAIQPDSNIGGKNFNGMQFTQANSFETSESPAFRAFFGQSQSKASSSNPSKNLDLQSTLKQLNGQLFNSNVSKNKSKKKLNSQEEEMIVNMFEKLVLNCKGRPVDFVKQYLDQYHSEKKSTLSKANSSKSFQFGASAPNQSKNIAINPLMSKTMQLSSPNQFKQTLFDSNNTSQKNTDYTNLQSDEAFFNSQINQFSGYQQLSSSTTSATKLNGPEASVGGNAHELCQKLDNFQEENSRQHVHDIHMKAPNDDLISNDDQKNLKQVHQVDFEEGFSNYTTEFNQDNTDTVQSLNSFNIQPQNQKIFNI